MLSVLVPLCQVDAEAASRCKRTRIDETERDLHTDRAVDIALGRVVAQACMADVKVAAAPANTFNVSSEAKAIQ